MGRKVKKLLRKIQTLRDFKALILVIILINLWFYWFQWRPTNIRKKCYEQAGNKARELYRMKVDLPPGEPSAEERTFVEQGLLLKADFDYYYEDCLHKEGLDD